MLKTNQRWDFHEHDGSLVARSSRTLEPFVLEAIDSFFPPTGPQRLLEVGCGTAVYIKYAAHINPGLTAVGLELQRDVVDLAKENIARWGLNERVTIEFKDIRDYSSPTGFDVVSLHNNIYYFDVNERIDLFSKVNRLLNPSGLILVTTGCTGGSPIIEMLNLWSVTTKGYGRLPSVDEIKQQLQAAGFAEIRSTRLIPGDQYHAFAGFKPGDT